MKYMFKRAVGLLLCGIMTVMSLTACVDVADTDGNGDVATTTTTASQTTTTLGGDVPSSGTTAPTTAPTTPPVDIPDEQRSPNVTYYVPASAAVTESYFDDVVFVGDSVSLKLTNYQLSTAVFGFEAVFLTSGSLGVANSMWDLNRPDAVHPSYQGEKVTVVDGIAKCGKSKVYLMLGVNDLGLYGVNGTFDNFKTLTSKILEKSPNVTLYIQSVTPLHDDYYGITNSKINEYNTLVSEYCREKGWYFVDVASVLRDDSGKLPRDYCSDPDGMGMHFTDKACKIWAEYLYTHTA